MKKEGSKIIVVLTLIVVLGVIIWLIVGDKPKTESKKNVEQTDVHKLAEVNNKMQDVVEPKQLPERRMSIIMAGDAVIHNGIFMDASKQKTYKSTDDYDFAKMFTKIKPIIKKYDLRYYNQESIIGGGEPSNFPLFCSPDAIGSDLVKTGFNLVSLANNHSFDCRAEGLKYSIDFWKNQPKKVHTAGSYASQDERDDIPVYEKNDIKYAFLAYTIPTNGFHAPQGEEYLVNEYSRELVKKDVETARNKGAEVVMVAMHWGVEYTHEPTTEQREEAKYLSELGVNLIIGSHPHVIQPIEYVGDTLCIYSLGNFISAQHELGIAKIIGLLAGTDIVVKDGKVTFDKTRFDLIYTYNINMARGYEVIPFSKMTETYLKGYADINKQYREIVDPDGKFKGKI